VLVKTTTTFVGVLARGGFMDMPEDQPEAKETPSAKPKVTENRRRVETEERKKGIVDNMRNPLRPTLEI
jgi:hypothetical protein